MKVAILTTDNREAFREYARPLYFGTAPEALFQGFAGMTGVEVHVVACAQQPMNSPDKLAENIFFHSLLVPKIGWLRTGYQGCIRAVRHKLREIRPDMVHGQGTERDCAISAVFSGYPNVLTIHGNMRLVARVNRARPVSYLWLAARLEQFTLPRSDGIVCITNYTREAVAALARRTWVVPNAVDSSFFEIKRLPASSVQILCIGNVDQRKNQNALIRAVDTLKPKERFELVFLGAASRDSNYAQEFFALLQTRPWCRYAGFADREVLKQHLASASGLVVPSLEENCPMVVLEAMAAGVPVAAARVGGVPDLVRPEETGFLFDPQNEEGISVAVKKLLEVTTSGIAFRAQTEARQRFHPKIIASRHLEIYQETLSASRC